VAASTALPGGGRELTTDLARRLEYDLPAAEALKRDAAAWSPESASVEPAVRAAMHQALARCVEQLVTDVRQAGAVDGVLLHGGGALLAGLREALAVASGVRVVVADPFAGLGVAREALPPRAVATAPAWALAWGLAARGLAE
jgi:type IV pilus assembly protein PilM